VVRQDCCSGKGGNVVVDNQITIGTSVFNEYKAPQSHTPVIELGGSTTGIVHTSPELSRYLILQNIVINSVNVRMHVSNASMAGELTFTLPTAVKAGSDYGCLGSTTQRGFLHETDVHTVATEFTLLTSGRLKVYKSGAPPKIIDKANLLTDGVSAVKFDSSTDYFKDPI